MSHGLPDYSVAAPSSTIFPVLDTGELAARLGAPSVFDRRGNLLFQDDFSNGLGLWETLVYSAEDIWSLVAGNAPAGGFSASAFLAHGNDSFAFLRKYIGYPGVSRCGFEVSFAMGTTVRTLQCQFYLTVDGYAYSAYWVYNNNTHDLIFYYGDGKSVTLDSDLYIFNGLLKWQTAKVVLDFEELEAVRLIFNEREHDLSGYELTKGGATDENYLMTLVGFYQEFGVDSDGYLDYVIVTQNEV